LQGLAEAAVGALHQQRGHVGLVGVAGTVMCPVVQDPEAVGGVNLAELHLDAVVGVAVGGQDVEAAPGGVGQLLGEHHHLAQAQPCRIGCEPVLQPPLVVAELT
jgi:hypothetical protein